MNEQSQSPRRPLASRNRKWAKRGAARLAAAGVTPNQISQASVGFAALGFLLFWAASGLGPVLNGGCLILAVLCIQARLLCNLFDGMVAIEGGQQTETGAFWNEAPDRAADLLLFWGAGLAAGSPALGLGCAALAVATAYLRELGRAEGLTPDYSGPMAKPHRMAALSLGCLLAALLPIAQTAAVILTLALWLILLGLVITLVRRSRKLLQDLRIQH